METYFFRKIALEHVDEKVEHPRFVIEAINGRCQLSHQPLHIANPQIHQFPETQKRQHFLVKHKKLVERL